MQERSKFEGKPKWGFAQSSQAAAVISQRNYEGPHRTVRYLPSNCAIYPSLPLHAFLSASVLETRERLDRIEEAIKNKNENSTVAKTQKDPSTPMALKEEGSGGKVAGTLITKGHIEGPFPQIKLKFDPSAKIKLYCEGEYSYLEIIVPGSGPVMLQFAN